MDRLEAATCVRVWLMGPFLVERRDKDGHWEPVASTAWDKASYARLLLKRLLSAPGRHVDRSTLIEDLWPHLASSESVERYPGDAAYQLRKVLGMPHLLKTFGTNSGYELANQNVIWLDIDAAEALLKEGEQLGRTTPAALPLLEQAQTYFQRGEALEGQAGTWCHARRATVERMRYRCRVWLGQAYEQQGLCGQAEQVYSRLLEDDPADEDALCLLLNLLHRQGLIGQTRRLYQQTQRQVQQMGLSLSPATEQFVKRLLEQPRSLERIIVPQLPNESALQTGEQRLELALSSSLSEGIMGGEREERDMDRLRRQIMQHVFTVAGTSVLFPSSLLLSSGEMAERLSLALTNPSSIDKKTLLYLNNRIGSYWKDRNDMILPSQDLLSYVLEDLQKLIKLLDSSLSPETRVQLCSIAGITAMLVGELYFDMSDYVRSRTFHDAAITDAHEAGNSLLEAIIWARKSFSWTYAGNRQEALSCIQIARFLAQSASGIVRAWLAAVEAEVQAHLGDRQGCLEALYEVILFEGQQHQGEDSYWIHFDNSLAAGYQGISFLKLSALGHKDLIENAQKALNEALNLLHPTMQRRRPTLLIDLAGTYVQQRNIEQACEYAFEAVDRAFQARSQVLFQRFLSFREDLKPWEETQSVKSLDEHVRELLNKGKVPEEYHG